MKGYTFLCSPLANSTIKVFLTDNDMYIYVLVFDRKAVHLSKELSEGIQHYIDDFYALA